MLQQSRRLRKSKDIERVYRQGRFGAAGPLHVKSLEVPAADTRITVVVAKKISKKAVVRNRIRRRLTAILADHWQTLRPGCAIVVTVRQEVSEISPSELTRLLTSALAKAGATLPAAPKGSPRV